MLRSGGVTRADDITRVLMAHGVDIHNAIKSAHAFSELSSNLGRWAVLMLCGMTPGEAQAALKDLGYIEDRLAWN